MTVETLKSVFQLRQDIEGLDESHQIAGKTIDITFLCDFGYMGRAKRFLIKIDGQPVGWKEVFIPWNFLKETTNIFILDNVIRDGDKTDPSCQWTEIPYSEDKWCPCCWTTIEDFVQLFNKFC